MPLLSGPAGHLPSPTLVSQALAFRLLIQSCPLRGGVAWSLSGGMNTGEFLPVKLKAG